MIEKVKLIGRELSFGNLRQEVWTETEREIIADVSSISQNEFFLAGRNGLNPQLKITIYSFEWHGEDIVKIKDKRYSVYRTYGISNTDRLELYLESKGGTKDDIGTGHINS